MQKQSLLYAGKAKTAYTTSDPERLILLFRDDTSAFDGEKVAQLTDKGMVNNCFNAFIMQYLASQGIATHFERQLSPTESLVKRLDMLPIESVVRNRAAGSLCRRLGIEENRLLQPPVLEFFLKNDALHDPMINDSHIVSFGWASAEHIQQMKQLTLQINQILLTLFERAGLYLVDYKLEFGLYQGQMLLGDEFSPDGCRLWDSTTLAKMDKDRFRQNLGGVVEAYKQVGQRLGVQFAAGENKNEP